MKTPSSRQLTLLLLALLALVPAGCVQQSMANQPKFKPLQPTNLFPDGRSSRTPEPGTIPRHWRDDPHLLTGKLPEAAKGMAGADVNQQRALAVGSLAGTFAALTVAALEQQDPPAPVPNKENGEKFVKQYATTFPMPVSKAMVERGQQRFNIYCSVCHGYSGIGDGIIVQRGFTRPPSLVLGAENPKDNYSRGIAYQGLLVPVPEAPVGYYFDVITRGYGAMPEHATQIPVEDRWAIVSYLKALQKSQHYPVSKMPAEEQEKIRKMIEADKKKGANHEGGAH
jgi:mono/diheme cytochrome c family protein